MKSKKKSVDSSWVNDETLQNLLEKQDAQKSYSEYLDERQDELAPTEEDFDVMIIDSFIHRHGDNLDSYEKIKLIDSRELEEFRKAIGDIRDYYRLSDDVEIYDERHEYLDMLNDYAYILATYTRLDKAKNPPDGELNHSNINLAEQDFKSCVEDLKTSKKRQSLKQQSSNKDFASLNSIDYSRVLPIEKENEIVYEQDKEASLVKESDGKEVKKSKRLAPDFGFDIEGEDGLDYVD